MVLRYNGVVRFFFGGIVYRDVVKTYKYYKQRDYYIKIFINFFEEFHLHHLFYLEEE